MFLNNRIRVKSVRESGLFLSLLIVLYIETLMLLPLIRWFVEWGLLSTITLIAFSEVGRGLGKNIRKYYFKQYVFGSFIILSGVLSFIIVNGLSNYI